MSARKARLQLLAWGAALGLAFAASAAFGDRLIQLEPPPAGSESAAAGRALERHGAAVAPGGASLLVFSAPAASAGPASSAAAARAAVGELPGVKVAFLGPARDGQAATVVVLPDGSRPAGELLGALRHEARQAAAPGVAAAVTGAAAATDDVMAYLGAALGRVEKVGLGVSLLALVWCFGSLRLAALPLAVGVAAASLGAGFLALLGAFLPVSGIGMVMTAVLSAALGLDYPLILLARWREEHARGLSPEGALAAALEAAGPLVRTSAAVIAVGGLALTLAPLPGVRSLGLATAAVAVLAAGLALGALPALLRAGALGWWLERRRLSGLRAGRAVAAGSAGTSPRRGLFSRFASGVVARPGRAFLASAGLLAALAYPALHARTWAPFISLVPPALEARRGFDALTAAGLAGAVSPLEVVVEADAPGGPFSPAASRALATFAARARADGRIASVTGPAAALGLPEATLGALVRSPLWPAFAGRAAGWVSPDGRLAVWRAAPDGAPDDPAQLGLVSRLRALARQAEAEAPGLRLAVGGLLAEQADADAALAGALPGIAALSLLGAFAVLAAALRSVALPLKALASNALPVAAGFGVVVLAFQHGWGLALFGGPANGHVQTLTPVVVASVLFALSLDYELVMLFRIREARARGEAMAQAIVSGMAAARRVVLGGAAVMLSVFVPYLAIDVRTIQEVGLGLVAALVLDATVVRFVLVPSAVALMGPLNEWFPFKRESRPSPGHKIG